MTKKTEVLLFLTLCASIVASIISENAAYIIITAIVCSVILLHALNNTPPPSNEKKSIFFEFEFERVINFPIWALAAYANGDHSGLSEQEIKLVEKFEKEYPHDTTCIQFTGEENEFCLFPEFGYPCVTEKARVYVLTEKLPELQQ